MPCHCGLRNVDPRGAIAPPVAVLARRHLRVSVFPFPQRPPHRLPCRVRIFPPRLASHIRQQANAIALRSAITLARPRAITLLAALPAPLRVAQRNRLHHRASTHRRAASNKESKG
jgi:hypothetical protein